MFRLMRSLLFVAAVALPLLLATRAAADPFATPWVTECLDCPPRIDALSNRTAALAPDGTLHAVYGGDAVYHLTYRGGAPAVEALEAPGPAYNTPIMGIDNRGRVHALYLKLVFEPVDGGVRPVGTLRYARQTVSYTHLTLPTSDLV